MDKRQFKELMTELLAIKKAEEALNTAFKKFEPDFNYISFGRYESLVTRTLKLALDDKDDWIGYWLYELDCGTKAKIGTAKDSNGKNIPLKTLDNLWDAIEKNV